MLSGQMLLCYLKYNRLLFRFAFYDICKIVLGKQYFAIDLNYE